MRINALNNVKYIYIYDTIGWYDANKFIQWKIFLI